MSDRSSRDPDDVEVRGRGWTGWTSRSYLQTRDLVPVQMEAGPELLVPRDVLSQTPDGAWVVPLDWETPTSPGRPTRAPERIVRPRGAPPQASSEPEQVDIGQREQVDLGPPGARPVRERMGEVPRSVSPVEGGVDEVPPGAAPPLREQVEEVRIPVVAERLQVDTRVVPTARVRVQKHVRVREQPVEQPLVQEQVEVQRVPVDRVLDAPAPMRVEEDEIVVPLMEERLVVEKRLVLREEIHIRRRRETRTYREVVDLRTEEVEIERTPEAPLEG